MSTVGDIMSTVGDIMSTVEGVQYRGGKNLLLFEYPMVLNTPHGTHDIPHIYHDIPPRYSNFKGWYPPTVLNTPTVLMISPHGTEHPPRYSR